MQAEPSQAGGAPGRRIIKWAFGIAACLCLACCFLPTLIYVFAIPTKYELQVGDQPPETAEVLNSQYVFAGMDWTYRFEIAYSDDQARDQMVNTWKLQPGVQGQNYTGGNDTPAWWPAGRINDIQLNCEWYIREDEQLERWWMVWVDREHDRLYVETGRW